MSDDHVKSDVGHYDSAGGRRSKRRGCAAHCKRFWWIYLLVTIVLIVLIVCLILFVAIPKIAQQKIDAAVLSVQGIRVTNTQSQNYTMEINSTITTDGSTHATIDPFQGQMYLEDLQPHTPFALVDFPASDSSAFQTVNLTQFTPVNDLAAFTTFNTWLLANDSLRVTVAGDTYVHISGYSKAIPVTFKKTIDMAGLAGFNGTTVSNVNISIIPSPDGTNMRGQTTIPNRSIVTFEIGNATFTNYLLGKQVGTTFINDMILLPGLNTFNMTAKVDQISVLSAVAEKPYCETGVLPFQLRGKSVVNHDQPLSYYADALASNNQTVPIDLNAPFKAISLPIKCTS